MINKKHLVLLVEDSVEVQEKLTKMMHGSGKYEVVVAGNGYEGLYQLDKHKKALGLMRNKIDCVIIDIKMPDMDGIEFLRRWRTIEGPDHWIPPMFRIPALFLSAFEETEYWNAAISLKRGILVEYLKKPVLQEQLLDTLERILINKETHAMQTELLEKRQSLKKQKIEKE